MIENIEALFPNSRLVDGIKQRRKKKYGSRRSETIDEAKAKVYRILEDGRNRRENRGNK
jgi:hypothetical protein